MKFTLVMVEPHYCYVKSCSGALVDILYILPNMLCVFYTGLSLKWGGGFYLNIWLVSTIHQHKARTWQHQKDAFAVAIRTYLKKNSKNIAHVPQESSQFAGTFYVAARYLALWVATRDKRKAGWFWCVSTSSEGNKNTMKGLYLTN